jgi:hypothetical protein
LEDEEEDGWCSHFDIPPLDRYGVHWQRTVCVLLVIVIPSKSPICRVVDLPPFRTNNFLPAFFLPAAPIFFPPLRNHVALTSWDGD